MNFDEIVFQRPEGWGRVFQGTQCDYDGLRMLPSPLVLVNLNRGASDSPWIDHEHVHAVLTIWIDDHPKAILPDNVMKGLVRSAACILKSGMNLYIHCAAGISRSSYFTTAMLMHMLNIEFDRALEILRASRPVADPNSGFTQHLKDLEPHLRSA
jgi:hypothetical protein